MANTAAKVLSTGPLVCISQSMTRAYIVTNSKRTVIPNEQSDEEAKWTKLVKYANTHYRVN